MARKYHLDAQNNAIRARERVEKAQRIEDRRLDGKRSESNPPGELYAARKAVIAAEKAAQFASGQLQYVEKHRKTGAPDSTLQPIRRPSPGKTFAVEVEAKSDTPVSRTEAHAEEAPSVLAEDSAGVRKRSDDDSDMAVGDMTPDVAKDGDVSSVAKDGNVPNEEQPGKAVNGDVRQGMNAAISAPGGRAGGRFRLPDDGDTVRAAGRHRAAE